MTIVSKYSYIDRKYIGICFSGSFFATMMAGIYIVIVCLLGIVIYVYNIFCDPVTTGRVDSPDQVSSSMCLQKSSICYIYP